MKFCRLIPLFSVLACLHAAPALAQARCDRSGDVGQPVDPALAPKIMAWTTRAEQKSGLDQLVYRFPFSKSAKNLPADQKALIGRQAVAAEWALEVPRGSVEGFYRQAVLHGINTQYEALMVREDPKNAGTHAMWRDTEAARANACLALTQPQ